jgi:hypothetical protein
MNTKNSSEKNFYSRPLRLFFLGLIMGSLMLMTLAAPSAHAAVLTYFNFNDTPNDFTSDAGQSSTITEIVQPPVSGGLFITSLTYTNPNQSVHNSGVTNGLLDFTGDGSDTTADNTAGLFGALDISGNTTGGGSICFTFSFSTLGSFDVQLSFALAQVGNGGEFNHLLITYTTSSNSTPTTILNTALAAPNTNQNADPVYSPNGPLSLGAGANNQTSVTIEFCFNGSSNSDTVNHTFIDNLQVTAIPEPSTVIGGVLGVLGLCWSQRRVLVRSLRLRRS